MSPLSVPTSYSTLKTIDGEREISHSLSLRLSFLLHLLTLHRQWTSFCSGGSISLYIYVYALYYFFFKTRLATFIEFTCWVLLTTLSTFRMYGLFQTLFYFGYMALGSATLGILCGKLAVHQGLYCIVLTGPWCRYCWLYWNKLLCEENLFNSED